MKDNKPKLCCFAGRKSVLFYYLTKQKYMKKTKRLPALRQKGMLKLLLTMKLIIAFLFLAGLHVSAKTYSQDKITLKLDAAELKTALRQIEKRSSYRFLYNDDVVTASKKVTINAQNTPVTEVLDGILSNTELAYRLLANNLVVISQKNMFVNDVKVTGRVRDDKGEPLPGVTIRVKGSSAGIATDAAGSYSITVPNGATLVFSSVGYLTQEIAVNGRTEINITLAVSSKDINEVVVIGYGTASKRDLTGSIVKVAGKDVADKPNPNPVASLQGRVAGLSVVNNGTPGQAPDIRIRGTVSIGSVTPLYVVDGILNDNIDYVNPNDIESIEILKDPSSLAIFGVRGAAGVIAITTKRAKAGQVVVNFNASFGTKRLVDKIKLANASQFRELFEEEKLNLNTPIAPFDYTPWTANTDWIDAVTRTGTFSNYNLSVASSTEKNKFNFGLGYISDEGLIKHEKLTKLLLSISDEVKLSKGIRLGFNLNAVRQENPYNATGVLDQARKVAPIVSSGTRPTFAKNPYGLDSFNQNLYYELPSIQNSGVFNPLLVLENEWNKFKSVEYRMVGSAFAEVNFLNDFTWKSTLYADMSNVNARRYTPLYNSWDAAANKVFLASPATRVGEDDNTYRKFQQDHLLSYKKKFGENNLTAMAGFTTYYFGYTGRFASVNQSATGQAIPNDPRFWYISNGIGDQQSQRASSNQTENSTVSGMFRVLYNYAGRYYFNATFRRDGSSQISPTNRWQNFWGVGAGWEFTKEKFMSSQSIINFGKLKASIGVLGNQNTYGFAYPFFPGLRSGTAAIFGNNIYNAFSQAYLPDPNLKWETVNAKDIGVEIVAFNNRLRFEASYFSKTTNDLMTYIPGINGAADGLKNIGSIRNSGIELMASWEQKLTKDLVLTVSGNLTTYKNKVLDLATKDFAIVNGFNRTVVGQPIGSFFGYIVEGVYQSYADKLKSPVNTEFAYGPGDLKYKDVNGDGKINTADRTFIGNPTPDFTYGGTIALRYKGFDFSMDINGVYGNEIYRTWGGTESPFQRVNYPAFKVGRWNGEGTSNWHPILGQDHRINYEASTYGIEDGSYTRIRNVQIGYNMAPSLAAKIKARSLRLFANIQNLKTFKHNEGYTPEFGGTAISFGVDNAGGAIPMISTIGINVSF
jgi:TonB-linked SusC/RagA family outer membrane protein